ncbi:hypothetical protein ACK9YZ_18300 [Rhizobium sp. ZK1]|uniref:hypothetical protein n=1 Tax=Rhizobium sp. ZK1 TaxID=3389872 RepID=UPI0039F6EE7A
MSLTFRCKSGDSHGRQRRSCPSEEGNVRACGKSRPAFQPQAASLVMRLSFSAGWINAPGNTANVSHVYDSSVTAARLFACSTQTIGPQITYLPGGTRAGPQPKFKKDFDHDIQA